MKYYPIFLDLSDKLTVVIGMGGAAENKVRLLRATDARIRWYIPDAPKKRGADVVAETGNLEMVPYASAEDIDLSDAGLVVCAAGASVDQPIAMQARALRIPVNVVDRPDLSTFIMPAIVDRGEVVVAIGTNGSAPVLARRLREQIEALLPARIGSLANLIGRYRDRLAQIVPSIDERRRFWERIIDGPIAGDVLAGPSREAETKLVEAIEAADKPIASPHSIALICSAERDPDLLSLRGLRLLQDAEVIIHDAKINDDLLSRARRDAERILIDAQHQALLTRSEVIAHIRRAAHARHNIVLLMQDGLTSSCNQEWMQQLQDLGAVEVTALAERIIVSPLTPAQEAA
ncbi:MAG TPA: bifunctional precorrin-2 dehydrogenase/sirohydrochlorin ferrochelatase [Xanthobacteraceae bacterium]|jgi:uroporphyrin-III C-methyltransferase/precorrin-2 dehydrogenase/sirohydrochlorin ferrochelatase|nr:bifunctional precorrin-2 dehydrogenase/sirohydrochlorin ferrochelatase [Xanthobacteraceae bacterium]